jgi:LPXTG-motif cell wall-anchored protein
MLLFALFTSGLQATVFAAEPTKQGTISVIGKDEEAPMLTETPVQYGENETAAEALVNIVGENNVAYTHYSFGDMITGINGLNADDSHFWSFYINGVSADVGPVTYKVQDSDKLSFRYESFAPATGDSSTGNTNPATGTFSKDALKAAIDSASQYVLKQQIGEWEAIALKQTDKNIPTTYLEGVKKLVKEKQGKFRSITDTERYTLGILAAGGDPTNIEGYNLIEAIYNGDVTKQGLNGVAYALLALDSANFKIPDTAKWPREKLVQLLLEKQNQDGGWTWDVSSTTSDIDTTGMVLEALAPYKDQAGVKEKVNSALQYITKQFNESKIDNSSTAAQVIIALSALGIDANGSEFTKDNHSLIQFFVTFQNVDGGFDWQGGDESDAFTTAQGIQALAAYQLYVEGKGSLYSLPLMEQKPVVDTPKAEQPIVQTPSKEDTKAGNPLPNTATNTFELLAIGLLLMIMGNVFVLNQKRRKA